MFTNLVESRAVGRRSLRGAVVSVMAHSLLIAAAVALTYPTAGVASPSVNPLVPVTYVPATVPHPATQRPLPATHDARPSAPDASAIHIPAPMITPLSVPRIDYSAPALPVDRIMVGGGGVPSTGTVERSTPFAPGAVLNPEVVDRIPRIVGNPAPPHYPDVLRQSGSSGKVVVRFVVDTLGVAELGDLVVVEATHPLFASAVKNALLGYRFTPGEVGGRKVRTMVQVPFSFTLR